MGFGQEESFSFMVKYILSFLLIILPISSNADPVFLDNDWNLIDQTIVEKLYDEQSNIELFVEKGTLLLRSGDKLKSIYNGNICLDLGSTLGSVSLYSRSNQIIESGGLILQIKQNDADEIWKKISNKITFTNNNNLIKLIDNMLINNAYCEVLLSDIYNNFKDSKNNMENNLNKIFN